MQPFQTDAVPGRCVQVQGRTYVWASGTAYLGLPVLPAFQQLVLAGLQSVGFSWGSSRNNSLQIAVFQEAEKKIAAFCGAPAALLTASGWAAGQTAVQALPHTGRWHYAPGTHPALWREGHRPSALPRADWQAALPRALQPGGVVCSDTVGSPLVENITFEWVRALSHEQPITLLLDDSHGLGLLGPEGRGSYGLVPEKTSVEKLVVASLNKAFGLPMGVVLGRPDTLARLRESPFFGGSSPASPGFAAALCGVLPLVAAQRQRLHENLAFFQEKAGHLFPHFGHVAGYPAFTATAPGLHAHLLAAGVLTSSFAYPTPADLPVTRIVISAAHTRADVQQVAEALQTFFS